MLRDSDLPSGAEERQIVGTEPSRLIDRRVAATPEVRALLGVVRLRDPLGVLSIYVDADPARAMGARPGWELRLRQELRFLEEHLGWAGRHDRAEALHARLTALESELVHLFHPSAAGRGRALFVPLGGGEPQRFALQLPLPDSVRIADTAHVRPLLDAFEAGRPAGVVGLSRAGARVLDVRLGVAEDVLWLDFEAATAGRGEPRGRMLGNPIARQPSARNRDRHRRHLDERHSRFRRWAAPRIAEIAQRRGWNLVLLRGDPRLVEPLRAQLASDRGFEVETAAGSLEWHSEHEAAAAVGPDLASVRRQRDWALVEQVRDEAQSGRAATLGCDETLDALNHDRVSLLLLGGADERPAERMIRRAFESGARVTPLTPEAAVALEPHDGVAALLRW
jgi:hypothetical protein